MAITIFDDFIYFKNKQNHTFDGISKFISELITSKNTNIIFSSHVLKPNSFYCRYRSIYYIILSIKLFFLKYDKIVFPFIYIPFGFFKKSVCVVHDLKYFGFEKANLLKRLWIKFSWIRSYKLIAISDFTFKNLKKHYNNHNKIIMKYNPYNFKEISSKANKRVEGFYLYVGHLNHRKNIKGLIQYANNNIKIKKLFIVGKGDIVINSNEKIKFLGSIENDKLFELSNKCEFFINLSFYEGFSYTPLEFLSMGMKLALSDIPVHRELYNDFANFINLEKYIETESKPFTKIQQPISYTKPKDYMSFLIKL